MNSAKQGFFTLGLLTAVALAVHAQEEFTSLLLPRYPADPACPVLTVYGYPGSTHQVQCSDDLSDPSRWTALTNLTLTNSSFSLSDSTLAQARPRFYRTLALSASPLTVPSNYVWIPPGTFLMGSPETEEGRVNLEGPQTRVTLTRGFYMGKYLVTQREYEALMRTNPSYFQGDLSRPVEACGWYNASNYCFRLTMQEQTAGRIPATWRYRLPTEAEWEYACRAGTTTRFSYGDDPGYTQLTNYAWYDENSYGTNQPAGSFYYVQGRYYTTQPVGLKLPNPWGLYDMHGSLNEWCSDWFTNFYPGGAVVDPNGPATGTDRVQRSGSWLDDPYSLRSAYRYATEPDNVSGLYGFRVVLAPVDF